MLELKINCRHGCWGAGSPALYLSFKRMPPQASSDRTSKYFIASMSERAHLRGRGAQLIDRSGRTEGCRKPLAKISNSEAGRTCKDVEPFRSWSLPKFYPAQIICYWMCSPQLFTARPYQPTTANSNVFVVNGSQSHRNRKQWVRGEPSDPGGGERVGPQSVAIRPVSRPNKHTPLGNNDARPAAPTQQLIDHAP